MNNNDLAQFLENVLSLNSVSELEQLEREMSESSELHQENLRLTNAAFRIAYELMSAREK